MKTYLKKVMATATLGLALVLSSLPTRAGVQENFEVLINVHLASGTTAGARYSGDSQQYIGCSFSTTNGPFVMCSATDNTGKSLVCARNDSRWGTIVKAITDFSFIRFSLDPRNLSLCTDLEIDSFSSSLK